MNTGTNTETEIVTSEETRSASTPAAGRGGAVVLSLLIGLVLGVVITAVAVWSLMPGMMIVTHKSNLGFDETVAALEQAITDKGWSSPGTMDMNAAMAKHGQDFPKRVKIVKLCKAEYAADVLGTDRYVSCLMPCSIAVWEADDGSVQVSKMNTGLMGKMFGGNIAKVMGQSVAADEADILATVQD